MEEYRHNHITSFKDFKPDIEQNKDKDSPYLRIGSIPTDSDLLEVDTLKNTTDTDTDIKKPNNILGFFDFILDDVLDPINDNPGEE